jgi:hypothetical protein
MRDQNPASLCARSPTLRQRTDASPLDILLAEREADDR